MPWSHCFQHENGAPECQPSMENESGNASFVFTSDRPLEGQLNGKSADLIQPDTLARAQMSAVLHVQQIVLTIGNIRVTFPYS